MDHLSNKIIALRFAHRHLNGNMKHENDDNSSNPSNSSKHLKTALVGNSFTNDYKLYSIEIKNAHLFPDTLVTRWNFDKK